MSNDNTDNNVVIRQLLSAGGKRYMGKVIAGESLPSAGVHGEKGTFFFSVQDDAGRVYDVNVPVAKITQALRSIPANRLNEAFGADGVNKLLQAEDLLRALVEADK